VTSGLDGLYPAGLAVGTILRVERDVKDQFAHVVLRPAGGVNADRILVVLKADAEALPPPPREESRPDKDKPTTRRGAKK